MIRFIFPILNIAAMRANDTRSAADFGYEALAA
jgi:hypothetical protein